MSTSQNPSSNRTEWWTKLGLEPTGHIPGSTNTYRATDQIQQVLAQHPPVAFAGDTEHETLTIEQVLDLIQHATEPITRALAHQQSATEQERQAFGWERIEAALTTADAHLQITEGRWAGFTKGEARAWCWNLMQYEPKGFAMPGMYTRRNAVKELAAGGLPEVFHYPERARELADEGLEPREYRRQQESANAPTFSEADVTVKFRRLAN